MVDIVKWPVFLPRPTSRQYTMTPGTGSIRSEMSSGWVRQRRMRNDILTTFQMSWRFYSNQMAMFEYFFKYDLLEGSQWFRMEHYTPLDNKASGRVVDDTARQLPEGETTYGIFRFVLQQQPYQATVSGNDWDVTATLERQNYVGLDKATYDFNKTRTPQEGFMIPETDN